jgi:hypothetical protein
VEHRSHGGPARRRLPVGAGREVGPAGRCL